MFICSVVAEAPTAVVIERRRNLYEVLRVNQKATQMEIKVAYRTLAKLYHPDAASHLTKSSSTSTGDGGGIDFIEIHKAYATLSDPDARAVYDSMLCVGSQLRRPSWSGSGLRSQERVRFYQSRKWETDQCWLLVVLSNELLSSEDLLRVNCLPS
ncbi:chaperone protein dnaJ 11, chloroplastic-like [Olea europaea var. sylvestris]|uniref:chaperone protein dnaJ 11, chloroplastic-like n=1 Tax=Olea europaea var. sylvestris TaxID=158386 RepID=UPI000C1CDF93|nr:chaperone protein dnaJ 11, chloroplastic-like [Olea europaea var. sylvestris]